MLFLKGIRWHKIGNVRDRTTFNEVELGNQEEGRNQKHIDESRQRRFGGSKEEGTKGKGNKTTKNSLKQRSLIKN